MYDFLPKQFEIKGKKSSFCMALENYTPGHTYKKMWLICLFIVFFFTLKTYIYWIFSPENAFMEYKVSNHIIIVLNSSLCQNIVLIAISHTYIEEKRKKNLFNNFYYYYSIAY